MDKHTQNILLTGASSGIGLELAKHFARLPVRLYAVCRNKETAEATVQQLQLSGALAEIHTPVCNLENQEEIRALCHGLSARVNTFDVGIFNAGCIMPDFQLTADGIEKQLAVNHLSSYIMCNVLFSLLKSSRLIFVSSRVYKIADADYKMVLGKRKFYHPTLAYAETKLLNLIFANQFAHRITASGGALAIIHPGTVNTQIGNKHTTSFQGLQANLSKLFARRPAQAALEIIELLNTEARNLVPGHIWYKGQSHLLESKITSEKSVERVMQLSAQLTNGSDINTEAT
jgi:NAD(P)-dependent dehydrogenase (short-subunit alcohol dehydrogenase family)